MCQGRVEETPADWVNRQICDERVGTMEPNGANDVPYSFRWFSRTFDLMLLINRTFPDAETFSNRGAVGGGKRILLETSWIESQ